MNLLDIMADSNVIVFNNAKRAISVSVAVSTNGHDGGYYEIAPGKQLTWSRPLGATAFVVGTPFLTKKIPRAFFIAAGDALAIEEFDLN